MVGIVSLRINTTLLASGLGITILGNKFGISTGIMIWLSKYIRNISRNILPEIGSELEKYIIIFWKGLHTS